MNFKATALPLLSTCCSGRPFRDEMDPLTQWSKGFSRFVGKEDIKLILVNKFGFPIQPEIWKIMKYDFKKFNTINDK